jgi:hypothetical protein
MHEGGRVLAHSVVAMPPELVIGRVLAICAHPICAWRVLRPRHRTLLVGAYALLGYVVMLSALATLHP